MSEPPDAFAGVPPQNTFLLGATRSGKTTSSGRALFREWMRERPPPPRGWFLRPPPPRPPPPGLLGLTVKANEADNLVEMARLAGREADVVRVSPGGKWAGCPLAALMRLPGMSAASAAKLLTELARITGGNAGKESELFWAQSRQRHFHFALVLLWAAFATPRLADLYRFVTSLPYGTEDAAGKGGFRSGLAAKAVVLAANGARKDDAEVAHAVAWVLEEWPCTHDKLRESYRQDMLSVVFPAMQEPVASLLAGDSLRPGLLDDGAVVILDLPTLKFGASGALFQSLWGCVFDLAMVGRPRTARTVMKWVDEVQWLLLPDWSTRIATVSSEARYFHVYMSQTLPTLYAALGGESAKDQVASLLSNSPLKVWHWNDCPATGEYASRMVGQYKGQAFSGGSGAEAYDLFEDLAGRHRPKAGVSFRDEWQPRFRPERLTTFRRGGAEAGFVCDALVTRAGFEPAVVAVRQTLI